MTDNICNIMGKKWAMPIVQKLTEFEELRFNELKNQLVDVTPSNLSSAIKEMEKNHIVSKKIYDHELQNYTYFLTNYGKIISQMFYLISILGKKISESSSKHHTLKISEKIIQEIEHLKDSKIIEDKEYRGMSETIETLIKNGINNVKNSAAKYFVPVSSICGMLSAFCIQHGFEHVEVLDSVL